METLEIRKRIQEKIRGVPTQLHKCHLLVALGYQTLYHINEKLQHFSSMDGYANYS